MSECPFHIVRSDLPPLTERIAKLPVDDRGYPVPFFVGWVDGKPEFRVADAQKWDRCVKEKLCWVCGEKLGKFFAFTIGPMCAINRTTAEPPAHLDCAEWSVKGCPFLAKPQMVRREDEKYMKRFGDKGPIGGEMIKRNPGAICIWVTKTYKVFKDGRGGLLIEVGGELESITWWKLGRPATREEVMESIDSGIPLLVKIAEGPEEEKEIMRRRNYVVDNLIPK